MRPVAAEMNYTRITFVHARKARLVPIPELQAHDACTAAHGPVHDDFEVVLNYTRITSTRAARLDWSSARSGVFELHAHSCAQNADEAFLRWKCSVDVAESLLEVPLGTVCHFGDVTLFEWLFADEGGELVEQ